MMLNFVVWQELLIVWQKPSFYSYWNPSTRYLPGKNGYVRTFTLNGF